jgi:hypothetical protein
MRGHIMPFLFESCDKSFASYGSTTKIQVVSYNCDWSQPFL